MNIGLIIPSFTSLGSDWHISLYVGFLQHLSEKHDVRVFPILDRQITEPYKLHNAYVFPVQSEFFSKRGGFSVRVLSSVEPELKKHHLVKPFDLLHAIGADEMGYLANSLGRQLNIPVVVTIKGGELVRLENINYGHMMDDTKKVIVKDTLTQSSAIVASCRYTAELAHDFLVGQRIGGDERISIVPLGVDTDLFKPPANEESERPRTFVHVGMLEPVKRQDVLLKLLAKLPGTTLDIVGDGSLKQFLQELTVKLGIEDRVVFHGNVSYEKMPAFYQAAQFLVMTSQYEAFGLPAIEALACGTGVIGSAVGVLPEVGQTAAFGNIEGLLEILIGRKRGHAELQRAQKRWLVENQYTVRHMAEGYHDVYRKLMYESARG